MKDENLLRIEKKMREILEKCRNLFKQDMKRYLN